MAAPNMLSAYWALTEYVRAAIGLSADQLLLQGCLDGKLPGALAEFAHVEAACIHRYEQPDGPELRTYERTFTVQGVAFRFDCVICYDPAREVYATEVLDIEPVEWIARLAVT